MTITSYDWDSGFIIVEQGYAEELLQNVYESKRSILCYISHLLMKEVKELTGCFQDVIKYGEGEEMLSGETGRIGVVRFILVNRNTPDDPARYFRNVYSK